MIALLAVAVILGLATSGYLLWKHYGPSYGPSRGPLICPFGQSCDFVLDSRYGRLLGFRNEIIGAGYYILVLVLLALMGQGRELVEGIDLSAAATALSGLAAAVSVALTAIQVFILRNYCSWCLLANLVNVFLFFGLLMTR